jgi:hypothetical protein
VLAGPVARCLEPRFGTESRAAHVAAGASDVSRTCAPTVRHDVDTWASLAALGCVEVGPATGRWLGQRSALVGAR